jgi:hypothetical protein
MLLEAAFSGKRMPVASANGRDDIARPQRAAPIDVCITVDTEFSIGGAFADPRRYRPLSDELVECRIDGADEGLGFILRALGESSIPGTFFVETLQSYYFGERRMGRIVERICAADHDVQLHLHPCWAAFRNRHWRSIEPEGDSCAAQSADRLQEMIGFAQEVFSRWGVRQPVALRAGGFSCGRSVHRAMVGCGITVGSNIALAIYRPADPAFHLTGGCRLVGGVLEVPALTYEAQRPPFGWQRRVLAIAATSWPEMEALLWRAREAGISPVVVLTHPFEFVKREDFRFRLLRRHRVNRQRLQRLAAFLYTHSDDFRATTFSQSASAWSAGQGRPDPLLRVPAHLSYARLCQNVLSDLVWRY